LPVRPSPAREWRAIMNRGQLVRCCEVPCRGSARPNGWLRLGFLVLALQGSALLGCYTTRDHGSGPCKEYRPVCLIGTTDCTRDSRGCELCTCSCPSGPCDPKNP
jgi:hypothetical protein